MLPKTHIILGLLFSILLYFIFHLTLLESTLVFLSAVFIDVDHYLWYAIAKKDIDPINSIKWFYKKRKIYYSDQKSSLKYYKKTVLIFHSIEFILLLLALSILYPIFLSILIGIVFHLIFDYIEIYELKLPFYPKVSFIMTYFKNQGLKELKI